MVMSTKRSAKNIANGNTGLIAPNRLVKKQDIEVTLDGVKMVFQNAPDTEAPVEMNTYFLSSRLSGSGNRTGTIRQHLHAGEALRCATH